MPNMAHNLFIIIFVTASISIAMAYDVFKKYVWLIDQVNNEEGRSLKQINEEWKKNAALSGGQDLSRFSFMKYRKAIRQYFGLDIYCEDNKYYVAAPDQPSATMLTLMEKLAVDNMLQEFANLKGRIVYEPDLRVAKGRLKEEEKLRKVADAMAHGRKLKIIYKPFGREEEIRTVHPYCVKMHQQRMYLISRAEERSALRTYCLDDRMLSVDFAPGKFSLPKDFDAEEYFRTAYGVVPQTEEIRPQKILLRADPTEACYLKAVRLHTSQKIEEDTDSYTIFSYYLAPTKDFIEEIIKRRGRLTIVEPLGLAKKLLDQLDQAERRFKDSYQKEKEKFITRLI